MRLQHIVQAEAKRQPKISFHGNFVFDGQAKFGFQRHNYDRKPSLAPQLGGDRFPLETTTKRTGGRVYPDA